MSSQENKSLPAILVGGAPNAGKSVLTYHLTQKLRDHQIPHYVLRANPDGEGDWYIRSSDLETVRQLRTQAHRKWSDPFRQLVSQAIRNRQIPLIVDIGGCPREEDIDILNACTHSLLLLRDDKEKENEIWRSFIARTNPVQFAELRSDLNGRPDLTVSEPVIKGTITGLDRRRSPSGQAFDVLVKRTEKLFGSFPAYELEQLHLGKAPADAFSIVFDRYLRRLAPPGQKVWAPSMGKRLLRDLFSDTSPVSPTPLALYGRGPNWLYGMLALRSDLHQPFYQFDARFEEGWIQALNFVTSASLEASQEAITLEESSNKDAWMLTVLLNYGYLDYELETKDLVFPVPQPGKGVIINGKLPLWLFTSLARFYARYNVPWIAFNYADDNRGYVIFSQRVTPALGDRVALPG